MLNLEKLSEFLVKAKRNTFAVKKNKTLSSRLNSEDYEFREGDFVYRDSFFGKKYDLGQEIVWFRKNPIWGMNYMGGMKNEFANLSKATFQFLRKCLERVDLSMPFRGPKEFKEEDFYYENNVIGEIVRFFGEEKIFFKGIEVYSRTYHGGLIKD